MNTDSYYEIGHSHIICEDYALTGMVNDIAFAIISDGCSSSFEVDVGARVLSHVTKNFLRNEYCKNPKPLNEIKASEFFLPIINSANDIMRGLSLPKYCLDCTLLLALSNGKETKVFACGDGCIVVKRKNGDIEYFRIEYEAGAPFYLSYLLDSLRMEDYLKEFRQKVLIHEGKIINNQTVESTPKFCEVVGAHDVTTWLFTDIEFVALMSDGVNTYEKMNRHEGIPTGKSISEITAYKNFSGKFVERRMLRFRKDLNKEQISHYDDISVATIHIG